MRRSPSDVIIDITLYVILLLVSFAMLFPFVFVLGNSLLTLPEYLQPGMKVWPREGITFDAYRALLSAPSIYNSYRNTVFLVVAGTSVSLFITAITAFAVSREQMKGASALTLFFVVTMLIQGGIVPSYLVVRSLGLINSLWAMIFPVTVNTFFLIILKNFFANVPKSLEESAYMDGANELYIFFRIFVPLSVPAMVTIGLFYGVNYFNSFFLGILYLTDRRKWPLQLVLRDILIQSEMSDAGASGHYADRMSHGLKMATIIVAVVPIACIYPFLQKYFSKGVLIGAVKG